MNPVKEIKMNAVLLKKYLNIVFQVKKFARFMQVEILHMLLRKRVFCMFGEM